MNGTILDYTVQTNSGLITGDDGNRYNFVGTEWKDEAIPNRGMRVDFEAQGGDAVAIYRAMPAPSSGGISGTLLTACWDPRGRSWLPGCWGYSLAGPAPTSSTWA